MKIRWRLSTKVCSGLSVSIALMLAALMPDKTVAATQTGHISGIYYSNPNNWPLRVFLDDDLPGCTDHFAYMTMGETTFLLYTAGLQNAYASGHVISLTYVDDGTGHCHIVEFFSQ